MQHLEVSVTGIQSNLEWLDGIQDRAANAAPFLRSRANYHIKRQLTTIFDQEGPGWKELTAFTIARREFPWLPILEQTGHLKRTVIDGAQEEFYVDAYIRKIVHPYAADHEYGRPDRNLPQRAFAHPALQRALPEIHREYRHWLMTGQISIV